MQKLRLIILFLLFFATLFFAEAFAINDVNSDEIIINEETTKKEKLVSKIDYNSVLDKAKKHSYDLKLADFEYLISKQNITDARSEYFPKLHAVASTEYTKNFLDYSNTTMMSVGDSFINPYTRYQALMGITLTYNLFDFGIRKDSLDISKEDAEVKSLMVKSQMQELELILIDTYTKILIAKKQIEFNTLMLQLEKENLNMSERLFEAKEISTSELNDQKIKVKKIENDIAELKSIYEESLNWLSFYTGEKYDFQNLTVEDTKKPDFNPMEFNDYTKTLVWQIQDKEIQKKELELKIAKKNYLPKVNVYSRYYIYGSDHSSYNRTLDDIQPTNYTVGGNIVMPVFDGFKTSAAVQKAKLALDKQMIERDKAIAQFAAKLSIMRSNLIYLQDQADLSYEIFVECQDKEESLQKLVKKQLATPIELNNVKIEKLRQEIEYIKNSFVSVATLIGIQTLSTY